MERSTIQLLAKRGKSQRQIAKELGRSRTTIQRVLHEPVSHAPAKRQRASQVDPFRPQIEQRLQQGLSTVRMLELARSDPDQPYPGGRSVFSDMVRRIRLERDRGAADVPVRFEGLPAEYLQVDWGEVRHFPFSQQQPATRYFLACRLKYSRWSWVRFTADMRQETLLRGLVACVLTLGWVPWVLVFDTMKTVTTGRDAADQPIWTPALLQLASDFGVHPQACDPGAGNQKGSVESLVKWVKGNFLPGRTFRDDDDLTAQATTWHGQANIRPSAATGEPPLARLLAEALKGGSLPPTAQDYGFLVPGHVSAESLVAVAGNRYSVPVAYLRLAVTVRLHRERVRIWHDLACIADHPRASNGAGQRVVDLAHFAPVLARKPRAKVMLYRQVLLELGGAAPAFLQELSRRHRDRLGPEVLAVYTLYERYGQADLLAAMELAGQAGSYDAAALESLLATMPPRQTLPPLVVPGVPAQVEVDRLLSSYEVWVYVDEVAGDGTGRRVLDGTGVEVLV
ncbi:MAG TPA: IS21 family transposase [Herpetosiphonaceae bacterium]|nr:IS21 family transposase [Herpetosiphonaceae bacterium]